MSAPSPSGFQTAVPTWVAHWARLAEPARVAIVDEVGLTAGDRLLDVGCGSGELCRLARSRGATVSGLDASAPMIDAARAVVPDADLRRGDMAHLPWDDDCFDVVSGVNSFQFADDYDVPLREAVRVLRPGGRLAVCHWGPRPAQDINRVDDALRSRAGLPPAPARPVREPGVVDRHVEGAGLRLLSARVIPIEFTLADATVLEEAFLFDAAEEIDAGRLDEAVARQTIRAASSPFARPDGSYLFHNEFRLVVGQVPVGPPRSAAGF